MAKFNQDGGGGGGAAPAAPAAPAPASAAPSPSPASPAPAAAPAAASAPAAGAPPEQGSGQGASSTPTAAPAASGKLIDTLPARYSPEYWAKFGEMTPEQRLQVESEWAARDSGQDAPPSEAPKVDPAAAPLPGDKPKGAEEVFITQEDLDKLPPAAKQVIETMQAHIDEFAPFQDEKFAKGMQMFMEDPLIKQRMAEISEGKVWEPGELAKEFKADTYLTQETLQGLDFIGDPEGSTAKLGAILQKAHADGIKTGQTSEQYANQQKVAFAERKATFLKGFNDLVGEHAELKPKDPSVKEITDPKHPLRPVLKWASEKLGDRFFLDTSNRNPFKAAYAAFLADGGKLDEAIASHVVNSNLKFIRNLTAAQTHAATVGRTTPSAAAPRTSPIPNLDVDRYLADPAYARTFYDNADYDTRLKLEKIRYGEKVT